MGTIQLQPRPLYGIGTVARLTGIKPDTLRIWERRYQLGASHKSASGRRQYTQADLEHLQLVAALVEKGARIGEIAASERRTLEMMLRARGESKSEALLPSKPRVAFVGEPLCNWLDEHQGCLMNVDAILAPCAVDALDAQLIEEFGAVDAVVVACTTLSPAKVQALHSLSCAVPTDRVLLLYQGEGGRWSDELTERGFSVDTFPPDPARLAVYLRSAFDAHDTDAGTENLGDLVTVRPRLFNQQELEKVAGFEKMLSAKDSVLIGDIVQDLALLEEQVAASDAHDWSDVAVQACAYAYVGQARWLMEKALGLTLDARATDAAA
ncbi:MAG: hypothetical protein Hals2KO_16700 [Halioglobus sp.]